MFIKTSDSITPEFSTTNNNCVNNKIAADYALRKIAELIQDVTPKKLADSRHPSKDLYVIGITGTNGKTTIAYLL